tara:strand:- start:134 stop:457 length:324 start_codon:yes stop_codon:yes gene_type:complete
MTSTIIITLLLLLNVYCFTYIRWLLRELTLNKQHSDDIWEMVGQYTAHVKSIHNLEMFYGDETLKSLIVHGDELMGKIENFDFILEQQEQEEENDFEATNKEKKKEE